MCLCWSTTRTRRLPSCHIRGLAAGADNPPEIVEWATRIGERYMGADRAKEFGERNGVAGELLVRLTPRRVIAQTGVAD